MSYLADNGSFFIQARQIEYMAVLSVNEAKSILRSRNFNTNESLTSCLVSFFFIFLFPSHSSLKYNVLKDLKINLRTFFNF